MPVPANPPFNPPHALFQNETATIIDVYEWHAIANPDFPVFRFHNGHTIQDVTYSTLVPAMRRVATYVNAFVGQAKPQVTVAILASADSISYALAIWGVMRSGHIPFPISLRNSSTSIAHLLRETGCKHVLVSNDVYVHSLAEEVRREIQDVILHSIITYSQLFDTISSEANDASVELAVELDPSDKAVIMHSSGSTSHPKPIIWSHKTFLGWSTRNKYGEVETTGKTFGCHAVPMFHALGLSTLCVSAYSGWIMAVFQPALPPTTPTSDNVFQGLLLTEADYVMTLPAFIEHWAQDPEKVKHLKTIDGLIFGGAPLTKHVGDTLASQGVCLIMTYGTTETGSISTLLPKNPGMDWQWFTLTGWHKFHLRNVGEGKFEIVVLSIPEHPLARVNTKIDGVDAFATNDFIEEHPAKPGHWAILGRLDDQIVLSNGEKTNPVPLENIINQDPHVRHCLIFGHGRFQNGVLIDPKPDLQFDIEDSKALKEFRNRVWPTIEQANAFAPQHSRIFKEMIITTSPSKPFSYSAKGYPRRVAAMQSYSDEISVLYENIERSSQPTITGPEIWDDQSTRAFVRRVITSVLIRPINDEADFFRNGCDSLQAAWIRNTALRAIRDHSALAAKRLPINVVYQSPTIASLTHAISHAVHGSSPAVPDGISTTEHLIRLSRLYSSDLPARPAQLVPRHRGRDVVLVTGTTGGFGCDMLEHLLQDEDVHVVYAFNRKGVPLMERHVARFRERGLDEDLLVSPKLKLIESELDVPSFGVDPLLLDEIRASVTHVLLNAWRVDFNISVSSFEGDIKGVRNFIDLALSTPYSDMPKIQFVSSIGVLRGCSLPQPIPEVRLDPASAIGTGYSEAKWVAEQILYYAADKANIPVSVVRLGQLCGDNSGHWNEREWFPAMVKSALFTRCLPDIRDAASFIPSYAGSRAFVEMRKSTASTLHLVHPRPVSLQSFIVPIAEELGVPLVPLHEWFETLEATARSGSMDEVDAMRTNPALRLLDFFRARVGRKGTSFTGAVLSTEESERASSFLHALPALDGRGESTRWMAAWRASGFLPP